MSRPIPEKVVVFPTREVGIVWSDGREDFFPARDLRISCPCAECVDEITGERRLDPESVPADLRVERWEAVGRYALRFHFSDGHATGIFTFEVLRA
ncbi:MAG: DUF971 domain-containing protein [Acidobacteriota bacterium]|nr:DUF971 domain-containing protein [Acidobacteriota bacterium]MDQ7088561.1 DUF971 domain-containing protein [Acidobacteriota bacterium]